MTHPLIECPHRKEVLRQTEKGCDVYRCLHIGNLSHEATKDCECKKCGNKTWNCDKCPAYDTTLKQLTYPKRPEYNVPEKFDPIPHTGVLRVAFLSRDLNLGGAERWIASLCQNFDRKRVIPTVVAVNSGEVHPVIRAAIPPEVLVLKTSEIEKQWRAVADVVIGWGRCDLTKHVIPYGIPAVSCIHGAKRCDWTEMAVDDALLSGARLVGVNEACRKVIVPAKYRDRMTVIPNGADENRIIPTCGRAEIRASLGIRPDQKLVVHVGRWMRDKDVASLASAVGELPEDWMLLVAGEMDKHALPDVADAMFRAKHRFKYERPRDNVGYFLAAADVFALLSPSEAHPLAVTEAWLAGVPVVCTDLPWIQSIEAEFGGLVTKVHPSHDAKQVAKAIERALEIKAKAVAAKAQAIAKEHFTARAMARRWEDYLLG